MASCGGCHSGPAACAATPALATTTVPLRGRPTATAAAISTSRCDVQRSAKLIGTEDRVPPKSNLDIVTLLLLLLLLLAFFGARAIPSGLLASSSVSRHQL